MPFAAKPSRRATQLPLFQWPRQQPSWEAMPMEVQQQVERLLARTGKANVQEVFPNFSLFVYGGVNYAPYRSRMETLIGGSVPSVELFPASEGFIEKNLRIHKAAEQERRS